MLTRVIEAVKLGDVETLLARLDYLVTKSKLPQRELDKLAGLRPGHVGMILSRLRKDPKRTVEAPTLARLARLFGVSQEWLESGQGSPRPGPRRLGEIMREDPFISQDPYPSRPAALRILRETGIEREVVAGVAEVWMPDGKDPGLNFWVSTAVDDVRHAFALARARAVPRDDVHDQAGATLEAKETVALKTQTAEEDAVEAGPTAATATDGRGATRAPRTPPGKPRKKP